MLNDEAKPTKKPRHLVTLIISLLVLLVLFLLIMVWYNRKINQMQIEEQKLRKDVSVNTFKKQPVKKSVS
jgi:hypothetical protein